MNINLTKSGATYSTKRKEYYTTLSEQLDLLYHDIDSSKFGETAKNAGFYIARKAVKDKFPSS